ncbi:hypothetical protein CDCA_CDCA06G1934 [Cyanidium caldarium]|uniref:26S proteasome non-ATPase regulatory subunit 10 n=1 Tax=Cyanidium caldarium TaxID=2771 RepID=A0AAV9IUT4_CYACA|nr:hypothetical protein CDCA_CDCA06G1934 [Cyanidium caldarium]|eukprot:ctg_1775.g504
MRADKIWASTQGLPECFDALERDDEAELERLLSDDAEQVRRVDAERRTALHWACSMRPKLVSVLLRHGADPAAVDEAGMNCVHLASCASADSTALCALLEHLRHQPPELLHQVLTAVTRSGATPLILAASKGNAVNVKQLLDADAASDLNAADRHGNTALMRATSAGHADVVRLLLQRGAAVNTAHPRTGQTAVHIACAEQRADLVACLVQRGGRECLLVSDADQRTPLDWASPAIRRQYALGESDHASAMREDA